MLKRVTERHRRQLFDELGGSRSCRRSLLVLREVRRELDKSGELGHLGQQVRAKVDNLLQQALTMDVEMAAFLSRGTQPGESIVCSRVIEGLEEQGDIVVQKIITLSIASTEHVTTRAASGIAAANENRHVEDLDEDIHDSDFLVLPDRLVESLNEGTESKRRRG